MEVLEEYTYENYLSLNYVSCINARELRECIGNIARFGIPKDLI